MMPKRNKPVRSVEHGRSVQGKARGERLRKAKESINPQNEVENLYAEDFAETSIYKADLNRALRRGVDSKMPEVLYDMLRRHDTSQDEEGLVRLVDQWEKGDPAAKGAVEMLLQRNGITETDIEHEAVLRSLPIMLALDQLQTAASARRDKALSGIVFWRQQIDRQKGSDPSHERLVCRSADALEQAKDDD
jgi:hypothetical protein